MSSIPQSDPPQPDREGRTSADDPPTIEDAYAAEDVATDAVVEEDDPQTTDLASRSLEAPALESDADTLADSAVALPEALSEDQGASDMAAVSTDSAAAAAPIAHAEQTGDWENELSAHRVAVELRRIESEVRALLEERDPKRKRKLSGTSRWQELEEDIMSWRFSGRFNEDALRRAQELIARRHYLFNHLRFLASTRPTWNS
jgi:hypothetical protein